MSLYEPWALIHYFCVFSCCDLDYPCSYNPHSAGFIELYQIFDWGLCIYQFLDEASLMATEVSPMYEYSRISLGTISLINFSFLPAKFCSILGFCAIQPLGHDPPVSVIDGLHL